MEFYNSHFVEVDSVDGSDSSFGLSLSHRLLTDDRLADMRRPKLVHFYVNGDIYYKGIDLSITPNRYINFQELLNDLEKKIKSNISMPMGIRKVFTRKGHQIYSVEELEDCEAYVAAGPEPFKALIYSQKRQLNRKTRKLTKLQKYYTENHLGHHYVHHSDNEFERNTYKPKVITVIKKSKTSHVALRVILNKSSLTSISQLIENLNNSFESQIKSTTPIIKLFTIGGKYVKSVEDVLRPDDVFVGVDKDGLTWKEIKSIISDLFKDDYEKINIYLQRWELNHEIRTSIINAANNVQQNREIPKPVIKDSVNIEENIADSKTNLKEQSKKSIKFKRSQSLEEIVKDDRPSFDYAKFNKLKFDNSDDLIIPIGKGPLPTSHLQNIMKNELQSRRHLESIRKAIIDREKARFNRQKMISFDRPSSVVSLLKEVNENSRSRTPLAARYYNGQICSQSYRENNLDIFQQDDLPYMPPIKNQQLIQPIMNRDILYANPYRGYSSGKLLMNRPRRNSLSVYLAKYRTFDMDKSDTDNFVGETIPNVKSDRSGKIPELDSLKQFQEIYRIVTQIGKGNFCRVFYGKSASEEENEEVAIKIISKANLNGREYLIDKEIDMLLLCRHEFVVHLLHQYETPKEIILVMELASEGDLLLVLESMGILSELQTSCVISKLCFALLFLQSHDIIHRNISLENILVKSISHHNVDVLLADFSNAIVAKENVTGLFGSPMFASPEMLLNHPYKNEVDTWSLGILTYMLLSISHPFMTGNSDRSQLFHNIINNSYDYCGYQWNGIMREAKELIDGLLNPKPLKRLTVIDILSHPWILMEGNSSNLCGRDIQIIQRSKREEIENELKILKQKSQNKIELKKPQTIKTDIKTPNNKIENDKSTKKSEHLFGFFRNKKRDESQIDTSKKEMKK